MRLYMNGHFSVPQESFLPSALWLGNDDAEDTDVVSENCICLEGISCESITEDNEWSVRWKGVTLETNDQEYDEDFSLDMLIELIKEKGLRVVNMLSDFDEDVIVTIDEVEIEYWDGKEEKKFVFPKEMLTEEIEFIW